MTLCDCSTLPGSVVCFGDPVVDVLVRVADAYLASIGADAGGSLLVSGSEMEQLLEDAIAHPDTDGDATRRNGGSAANVARCLARLGAGGGAAVKFMGMVGVDDAAEGYEQELQQHGVQPLLLQGTGGAPTASCLCLVTPGGQRTMRTCLGASAQLASPRQLPRGWADGCAWLHCEGYCLHRPQVALAAMRAARQAGARVSLDLASFEVVRGCWPTLATVLAEGLLHTVFANEEEAAAVVEQSAAGESAAAADLAAAETRPAEGAAVSTADCCADLEARGGGGGGGGGGAAGRNSPAEAELLGDQHVAVAQRWLLRHCQVAVVSLGARGCVARSADGGAAACAADRVVVEDSVGAGDSFSAGWLAAYFSGTSLAACAAAGCAAGTAAVQAVGGVLGEEAQAALRRQIAGLLDGKRQ